MEQLLNHELSFSHVLIVGALAALTFALPKLKGWWAKTPASRRYKMLSMCCWLAGITILGVGIGDVSAAKDGTDVLFPVQARLAMMGLGGAITVLGVVLFIRHCDSWE